jgi:uncharacterized protein
MRTNNRPWPVPGEPWLMVQTWENLLFAHWRVSPDYIRPFVSPELEIDTYDGDAWIGITPFDLTAIRWRGLPRIPSAGGFPETNVRTYVRAGDKPGVYFFSLDAASRLAVEGARIAFGLPYFTSEAKVDNVRDGIHYRTTRVDSRGAPATFHGEYWPTSALFNAEPGTLEYFLTERYCLYTRHWGRAIWRAEIDHAPWPLQTAEADIRINTMADAAGITLPDDDPVLHFARYLDVKVWRPMRVPEDELLTVDPPLPHSAGDS